MIYTTRLRLILGFLGIVMLVGGLSLLVGGQLINRTVLGEAANRIRMDLNAAREIYTNRQQQIRLALGVAAREEHFRTALAAGDPGPLASRLGEVAGQVSLDFTGVVDASGRTLCRLAAPGTGASATPADGPVNPAALQALTSGQDVYGTVVLDQEALLAESPALAARARIDILPTPRAAPRQARVETSGMTLACGLPVFTGGRLLGVVYGGTLLNRNQQIVDRVRETVFQNELYHGQCIGTATIFFGDLRIATNVMTPEGQRAIGTRVSEEVNRKVLLQGERWTDRAFVVHNWYISAYEPIVDIFGRRVGILYTGVLEDKYVDIRRNTLLVFVLITVSAMVVAVILGYVLGQRMWRPVQHLVEVSRRVSGGDLSPEIGPISHSEIGVLQRTFGEMLGSLRERDRRQQAESEDKLLQSERQASVGRLAAGVAHEINNPLTGVLTFTHMLLRRQDLNDEMRADLETIAQSTERVRRIVKGLLDFSRQTKLEPEPTDVNALVQDTLKLVANQALVKGVIFCFDPAAGLPQRTLDRSQFQSVLMNILINAIDATGEGGHINISTGISLSAGRDSRKGIEIAIADTGCGIPQENLDRLFDPFFTTKEVGRGTGLGLSVSLGIVQRHGGTIRVQSTPGKGSTFIVWLPLDEQRHAA